MTVTRICLVRHGETAWNAARRIQGHCDIPLNANGVAQARAAANGLQREAFAAVYSSDLVRARHTADAIGCLLHVPVQPCTDLRERHFGVFQALTHDECRRHYPADYGRLVAREPDFDPPGGESLARLARRVRRCIDDLARRHRGDSLLLVTHGGVLDAVYRHATGRPLREPRNFALPNAACNWIEVDGDRWSLLAWADRTHLVDALDELPA